MMKKTYSLLYLLVALALITVGCSDNISFADMKKAERAAIEAYLEDQDIKVITEEEFFAQDSTTDVTKNEYVLFSDNGVYMQIIRKGEGSQIDDGTTRSVLCRYTEVSLMGCDTVTTNIFSSSIVDKMLVTNDSGTYTGTFTSGYMMNSYSTAVPVGWLVPMPYIRLSRNTSNLAKVRLIVPYSYGTVSAMQSIEPFWYEVSYQAGL